MAYRKVLLEVWCDWNPAESGLDEIAESMRVGEAICTRCEVVNLVHRPQDIEDEEAATFFGGLRGRRRPKSGVGWISVNGGPRSVRGSLSFCADL